MKGIVKSICWGTIIGTMKSICLRFKGYEIMDLSGAGRVRG
jgi:hypothetical protein